MECETATAKKRIYKRKEINGVVKEKQPRRKKRFVELPDGYGETIRKQIPKLEIGQGYCLNCDKIMELSWLKCHKEPVNGGKNPWVYCPSCI